jgi:hypothetical protein
MGRAAGVLAQAGNTSAESLERRRHVNDGVASLMFPIAILRKCLPFAAVQASRAQRFGGGASPPACLAALPGQG